MQRREGEGEGGRARKGDTGLAVASGTVFNEVLLWQLDEGRPPSDGGAGRGDGESGGGGRRVRVSLFLTGHEVGVTAVYCNFEQEC